MKILYVPFANISLGKYGHERYKIKENEKRFNVSYKCFAYSELKIRKLWLFKVWDHFDDIMHIIFFVRLVV